MIPARCWFDLCGYKKMRSSLVFGDTTEGHHSSLGMNFQWKLQFKNGFGDAPPAFMQIVDLHAATRIADEALIFHYLKVHQFFFIFVMQNHRPSPLLLIATIARQFGSNFSLNFFSLTVTRSWTLIKQTCFDVIVKNMQPEAFLSNGSRLKCWSASRSCPSDKRFIPAD